MKRYSRLSPDDGHVGRRAPSPSSCEKSPCPACGQLQLTTVSVDGDLPVSVCYGCNQGYGVDDAMDAETLAQLLVDEDLYRNFQMTAVTCAQCHNNDVERFIIVDLEPDRQVLRVKCQKCSSVSDIPLKDWAGDGSGNGDDTWMAEVLGSMNDEDEDDGGSLWSDGDSGYFVDSEGEHDVDTSPAVVPPITCDCGNSEVGVFEKHFDPVTGDLSRVKCLNCDAEIVLGAFFGVECWHCSNDTPDLFERHFDDYGRMTALRCLQCDKRLDVPGQPASRKKRKNDAHLYKVSPFDRKFGHFDRQIATAARGAVDLGRTKIADVREVKRGDHVAWHKWYALWHHAIVVDVPDGGRSLTVIHYDGGIKKLDGHFASVRLETLGVNPLEDFYRIDYPAEDTLPVDEVVQRAFSRLGEAKYNPFTNNCEHFARWCKTGHAESGQVRHFTDRVALAGGSGLAKAATEMVADGIECAVMGSMRTFGRISSSIPQRAAKVFCAASGAVRNVKFVGLACNVAVNFALEAGLFARDAINAYSKYKSGDISGAEFRRQLGKQGCESLGGLIGGTALGILGQVLIPIPFVGGIIGTTVGSLIGRGIGAIVGKILGAFQ